MSRRAVTIGVDLGGTKVATALVGEYDELIASKEASTGYGVAPTAVISQIVQDIENLCRPPTENTVLGIGVGAAGQVDSNTGVIRASSNLGWENVALKKELEQLLSVPVLVINDVQAAAWGEWKQGAGQGVSDMVCLFVGTGIGGGIISRDSLLSGSSGSAGEFGHTVIDRNGPLCRCGRHGCLEAFAGGWAIASRAQEAVTKDPEIGANLLNLANGLCESITASTVSQAAQKGDSLAHRIVFETGEALSLGIASIVNTFNPKIVVLGGGVIEGLPELINIVKDQVSRYALPSAVEGLRIQKATLKSMAGAIGAAILAKESFGSSDMLEDI
jgi:glucokinase